MNIVQFNILQYSLRKCPPPLVDSIAQYSETPLFGDPTIVRHILPLPPYLQQLALLVGQWVEVLPAH